MSAEIIHLEAVRKAVFRAGRRGSRSAFLTACYCQIESALHHHHLDQVADDLRSPPEGVTDGDLAAIDAAIARKRRWIDTSGPRPAA